MNSSPSDKPAPPVAKRNHSTRRTHRWIPYTGAVILVALIVAGLWPKPAPVEIARATIGVLRATVNEEGTTRIKNRFTVSAPVAGQLRRPALKPGADVHAGQTVVAKIDPLSPGLLDARSRTLAEARRDTAFANLEKAGAAHTFAAGELRRFERLFAEKSVALQELETIRLRESSAAKDKAAADSALRQAEAELAQFNSNGSPIHNSSPDPTEVKAPASGRVLRVFEESSRPVASGAPLLEIGDPADLEVVIEVLSRDGAIVPPNAKVELEQWGGNQPLEAKVRLVEPAAFTKVSTLGVEEQRVQVIADLVTPPDQRRNLGDNFRVEARIVIWETGQALKVPTGALFRRGEDWAVFVVAGGRAQFRLVRTGRSSGTETQLLEGLKEGEEVILYPGDHVRDGQRVKALKI